jgi:hypothetical protein
MRARASGIDRNRLACIPDPIGKATFATGRAREPVEIVSLCRVVQEEPPIALTAKLRGSPFRADLPARQCSIGSTLKALGASPRCDVSHMVV